MKRLLLNLTIILFVGQLNAQNCFTEFQYHLPVTLAATEQQGVIEASTVAIPINTKVLVDEGKLKADGSGLRVTDVNCNELPFFVQGIAEREMNILYVKVPETNQDGITIQLYYGNKNNVTSRIDGNQVFDFFDDFEDGTVDLNKWDAVGAYDLLEEKNGMLRFTGSFGSNSIFKFVTPKQAFTDPVTFDFAANSGNSQVYGIADTTDIERIGYRYNSGGFAFDTMDLAVYMFDTINGGTGSGNDYPMVKVPRNDLNIISVSAFIDKDGKINLTQFINHSNGENNLDTLRLPNMNFSALRPFFSSFGSAAQVEYVGARPTSPIPVITFGNETEINTTSASRLKQSPGVLIYPNPARNKLYFEIKNEQPERITIFDLAGSEIARIPYRQSVDISYLNSGNYLVKLNFEKGNTSTVLIKVLRE